MDPTDDLQGINDDLQVIDSYVNVAKETTCGEQKEMALRLALKEVFCFMKKYPQWAHNMSMEQPGKLEVYWQRFSPTSVNQSLQLLSGLLASSLQQTSLLQQFGLDS